MANENPIFKFKNTPGTGPIIRNDQGAGAGADRDFIQFKKGGSETFSVNSSGLIDPGGGDGKRIVEVSYGDLPADGDLLESFLHKFTSAVVLTNIYICVNADTADGTTNKQVISVKRSSDDAEVVGFTTAAANPGMADETWTTLGALANTAIGADEYLYVDFTKTSAGLAMVGLTFKIEFTLSA